MMPRTLEPYTFPLLQKQPAVFHGSFSRHGGHSPEPFASLNVSFNVGDDPENVADHRRQIKNHGHFSALISARQVHGKRVAVISTSQDSCEIDGVDALICSVPGIGILIQQADCQAILLYDPKRSVVAAIHSGWQGSVANIIAETIQTMTLTFGTSPADIIAGISPSLGPCCAEFIHFKRELPKSMHQFQTSPNHFDFWAISTAQLTCAGLNPAHINQAGICTKCNADYFSYRRNKQTGRCCSVIGLHHG